MDPLSLSGAALFGIAAVTFLAGFVKGAVGFGMPMIMISALGSFLEPQLALAVVILPTLATNLWQALGQGWRAAWQSLHAHARYLVPMLACIALSAQAVRILPERAMLAAIGAPVAAFSLLRLLGYRLHLSPAAGQRAAPLFGAVSGLVGGVSGVWGPPLILYLTAIDAARRDQMRVQGVVFLAGAAMLTAAHLRSGVLNAQTWPLSLAALGPAALGMVLGTKLNGALAPAGFRRLTLVVLALAGLNLLRRAVAG